MMRIIALVLLCGIALFAKPLVKKAASAAPDNATEMYALELTYNGKSVGATHVTIEHPHPTAADYIIEMSMKVPGMFPIARSVRYTLTNDRDMMHYYCNSQIDFAFYKYVLYATNFGSKVYMRKIFTGGLENERWIPKSEFDFITGTHYRDYLIPGSIVSRRMRVLDLESSELYTADFMLYSNYTRMVNGKKTDIYGMAIRSDFITQVLEVMTKNEVPLTLDISLPVLGMVYTKLTNASIGPVTNE
ncbi:MAG: hypothetical protein AABZ39_02945 [Spirochaetota bacterium]